MENKRNTQFWQLWMVLSLFSAFLFPFTGIIAAVKMVGAKNSDYTIAKRWTITTYILFAATYCILLVIMSIHFVHLLPPKALITISIRVRTSCLRPHISLIDKLLS